MFHMETLRGKCQCGPASPKVNDPHMVCLSEDHHCQRLFPRCESSAANLLFLHGPSSPPTVGRPCLQNDGRRRKPAWSCILPDPLHHRLHPRNQGCQTPGCRTWKPAFCWCLPWMLHCLSLDSFVVSSISLSLLLSRNSLPFLLVRTRSRRVTWGIAYGAFVFPCDLCDAGLTRLQVPTR